jgi:hypothetical protein
MSHSAVKCRIAGQRPSRFRQNRARSFLKAATLMRAGNGNSPKLSAYANNLSLFYITLPMMLKPETHGIGTVTPLQASLVQP